MASSSCGDRADDRSHEERRALGKELAEGGTRGPEECYFERVRAESSLDSVAVVIGFACIFADFPAKVRTDPAVCQPVRPIPPVFSLISASPRRQPAFSGPTEIGSVIIGFSSFDKSCLWPFRPREAKYYKNYIGSLTHGL